MSKRPRIVVFGSLHMDLIAHTEQLPDKAQSGLAHGFTKSLGGKGGHQAMQCAAEGADVCMITQLGDDEFGRSLLAELLARGVNCDLIHITQGQQTGASTVLSAPEGYSSLIFPGAAAALSGPQIVASLAAAEPFDMLLLQLELPRSHSMTAAQAAKRAGARIVLNASPAGWVDGELNDLLPLCDYVIVNESEALALAGVHDALHVAQKLNCTTVVTRGANGSSASDGRSQWHADATPVSVTSTVGAGDAFLAGFCVARCRGEDVPTALVAGARAAARKLST